MAAWSRPRGDDDAGRRGHQMWRIGCLFHEVWDTTNYTEKRTHIYNNRLADLPAVDSRISPEMLVHSRPPQYLIFRSKQGPRKLFNFRGATPFVENY